MNTKKLCMLILLISSACTVEEQEFFSLEKEEALFRTNEFKLSAASNTSCDPLGGSDIQGDQSNQLKGLVGNIRVLKDIRDPGRRNLNTYLNESSSLEIPGFKLFMNDINVPERRFDKGFESMDENFVLTHGERLLEWFNINLESEIRLPVGMEPAEYEFALLSDDGAFVNFEEVTTVDDQQVTNNINYIHSPNAHSPTFLCGQESDGQRFISMSQDKSYKLKVNYFQGPRVHIALQMFWRKKSPDLNKSSFCEKVVWTKNAHTIFADGWEVVPSSVFNMPGNKVNTCATENQEVDQFILSDKPNTASSSIQITIDGEIFQGEFEVKEIESAEGVMQYVLVLSEKIILDEDKEVKIEYVPLEK